MSVEEVLSPAEERFERWRKLSGIVLGPIAFFATYFLTAGQPLSEEARRLTAILAGVAVFWMTETLPLPVTAVFGAVACVLLGVADATTVFAPFADPIIFLFLGSFILARAMTAHGLDRRIALGFLSLRWIGASPGRLLAGLGLITALLSMWVSNTATTAMMTPIALGILLALQPRGPDEEPVVRATPFATSMLLMIAYGASIGGIGTPVGSPPNLIGLRFLREAGTNISFFEWMSLTVPMLVLMWGVLFILLFVLNPARRESGVNKEELADYLQAQQQALGAWTAGQRNTLLAFGLAVTLWMLPGVLVLLLPDKNPWVLFFKQRFPEAVVALLAAGLLFVLPIDVRAGKFTMNLAEAMRIDWGTLFLFGGGLTLGSLMSDLKVADWIGKGVTNTFGAGSLWGLTAVSVALGIALSETSSNTASANMLVPLVIPLALAAKVSVVPPALGACLGASYGFMLPVSTPPNAIVYGTGLVPITRMVRAGILFDILGFLIIVIGLRVLCPLLGWA
ncbi:MAG: DASS family sodium-coupled anion symporter [Gemmataceae bacterium]